MADDSCCHQPPFKRGKVSAAEKRVRRPGDWAEGDEPEEKADQPAASSSTLASPSAPSWCSTLTPKQRQLWAKLMQQRKPPCLDLSQLSDELVSTICNFLDAPTLARMQCLCRRYHRLCQRNEAGWDRLCRQLWKDKVHVPPKNNHNDDNNMMKAYKESWLDARDRQSLTLAELCYDPRTQKGTVWSFRFKESAGDEWTRSDRWYQGEPARKLVFLLNGTVKQYVPGSTTLESPRFDNNEEDEEEANDNDAEEEELHILPPPPQQQQQHNHNNRLVEPAMSMGWRFLTKPMDLPSRTWGSYIRLTVGGRDVPTYAVRRSPTGNWGFVMESCWGVFTSFEMPSRRPLSIPTTTSLATATTATNATRRPIMTHRVLRRTHQGNVWVPVVRSEHEEEDAREEEAIAAMKQADPMLPLRDDSFMIITNDVQWREAFLYNVGARVLPEGDDAADEFDRAWGGGI